MKKISENDPLKLRSTPGGGARVYLFLVLTLLSLGATVVLYFFNSITASGRFFQAYYADIQTWKAENLANKMGLIEMSFKINPMVDALRNRDMFPMEHRGYVNAEDKKLISW